MAGSPPASASAAEQVSRLTWDHTGVCMDIPYGSTYTNALFEDPGHDTTALRRRQPSRCAKGVWYEQVGGVTWTRCMVQLYSAMRFQYPIESMHDSPSQVLLLPSPCSGPQGPASAMDAPLLAMEPGAGEGPDPSTGGLLDLGEQVAAHDSSGSAMPSPECRNG